LVADAFLAAGFDVLPAFFAGDFLVAAFAGAAEEPVASAPPSPRRDLASATLRRSAFARTSAA